MPLPDTAPHLTEKVPGNFPVKIGFLLWSFHYKTGEQIVKEHHHLLSQNEINNLAVLVLDVDSRKVLAYVGNAPAMENTTHLWNIIDKSRSTGSILKPFCMPQRWDGELLPEMFVGTCQLSLMDTVREF